MTRQHTEEQRLPPPPSIEELVADPQHAVIEAQTNLVRIFTTAFETGPLTFRKFGPMERFDHHLANAEGKAYDNPDRRIYYASFELEDCLVEVFPKRFVERRGRFVAYPRTLRNVTLLDLRKHAAMRAGTQNSIAGVPKRAESQIWARYFHEYPDFFGYVDGLIYENAHNGGVAVALFERAEGALECPEQRVIALDHPGLDAPIRDAAIKNSLIIP